VVARLIKGVRVDEVKSEDQWARVLTGLLREVDPLIDPDHISHLPSSTEVAGDDIPF
jgi:hypothetical protein